MATVTLTDRTELLGHGAEHARASLWEAAGAAVARMSAMLILWQERAAERRQLLGLGDSALKDFGACRVDAASEGGKPFWRT